MLWIAAAFEPRVKSTGAGGGRPTWLLATRSSSAVRRSSAVKVCHDPRAVQVEMEAERAKASAAHGFPHAAFVRRPHVEHEKSPASGAHQLAAHGSRAPSRRGAVV